MKALIVIDIQNDFLPGGSLAVPGGDAIISVVNQLLTQFELVVATQDWHPKNHKSFASNHEGKKPFDTIELNGMQQVLWPNHCEQGTAGAELSNAINWNTTEAIFRKGTNPEIDSYSGFYDNGHLKSTGLADYLRGKAASELYVVGLAGDYCVYYTAKDAVAAGFTTYVIEDATRPISTTNFDAAQADLLQKGVQIITSREINNLPRSKQ